MGGPNPGDAPLPLRHPLLERHDRRLLPAAPRALHADLPAPTGRPLRPGRSPLPQRQRQLALGLQEQHGRRQGAHSRVLLSARLSGQHEPLRAGQKAKRRRSQRCRSAHVGQERPQGRFLFSFFFLYQ